MKKTIKTGTDPLQEHSRNHYIFIPSILFIFVAHEHGAPPQMEYI